jgi:hypothetical protein
MRITSHSRRRLEVAESNPLNSGKDGRIKAIVVAT